MTKRHAPRLIRFTSLAYSLILMAALFTRAVPPVHAATSLGSRYLQLSSGETSAPATHVLGVTYLNTTDPLGSLEIEYCSNDPFPGTPCTAPSGLDLSGATLAAETGETGFVIDPASTANRLLLTRTAAVPAGGLSTYEFEDVINPDTRGSYYVRLQTFSSEDGAGTALEDGGIVFAVNPPFTVTAEVPPYLKLCAAISISGFDCATATDFLIDFGEFSTASTSAGSSQFVVATNAEFGFTVSLAGNTLTSGSNIIPALTSPAGSIRGVSQFGLNLRDNSNPDVGANPTGPGTGSITADYAVPNLFKFRNGDAVVTSATTSSNHKFTLSYIANVSNSQAPGVYATTISLIALANF
jgi:hypothetical protein